MKRFKFFFIFAFLGFNISAQNKFSLSFDASPTLSFRNNKFIDYSPDNPEYHSGKDLYYRIFMNGFKLNESPKFGFQISLYLGYYFTDKFSIQTGFQYKNIGSRWEIPDLIGVDHYPNGLTCYRFGNNRLVEYSTFHYVGIPINIEYQVFSFTKYNVTINAGGTIDFLSSHEEGSDLNTYFSVHTLTYSKIVFNANGGIKLSYTINDRLEAYLMSQYVQYMTPNVKINLDVSGISYYKLNQYSYFGALKFGIKYRI